MRNTHSEQMFSALHPELGHYSMQSALRIWPSRPGEFHPEPLTDPDLTLSRHPARATARRLPPSVENWSSSCCQLARSQRRWPVPFAPRALPRFLAITEQSAPARRIGTFGLAVSLLVPFPLASPDRFSSSVREPERESCLLYTGHRVASR